MDRCQNEWDGFEDDLSALLEEGTSEKPDADRMIALVDSMKKRVKEGEDFTLAPGDDFAALVAFFDHFAKHPHNYVLKPVAAVIEDLADKDCLVAEFAIAWDFLLNLVAHAKHERDAITATLEELAALTDLDEWQQEIPAAVHSVWTSLEPELREHGIDEDALDAMSTALDINTAQAELLAAVQELSLGTGSVETTPAVDVLSELSTVIRPFTGEDAPSPWPSTISWLAGIAVAEDWEDLVRRWEPSDQLAEPTCPHKEYSHDTNTALLAHNLHLLHVALRNDAPPSDLSFILSELFCTISPENLFPANVENKLVKSNFDALWELVRMHVHTDSPGHEIASAIQETFDEISVARAQQRDPHAWT